jgi:hypothetical protein
MTWLDRVHDRSLSDDVDALTETVELLFQDLAQGRSIDLRSLSSQVNPIHLAVVLRACSDDVPGWKEAVDLAYNTCLEDGIDPHDALYGMIPRRT